MGNNQISMPETYTVQDILDAALAHAKFVAQKDLEYGQSWKKRGGVSAGENVMRKVDRLTEQLQRHDWNIFKAIADMSTGEGLIDTIRDLRGYLLLVEVELIRRGVVKPLYAPPERLVPRHVDETGQRHPFGFDPSEDLNEVVR